MNSQPNTIHQRTPLECVRQAAATVQRIQALLVTPTLGTLDQCNEGLEEVRILLAEAERTSEAHERSDFSFLSLTTAMLRRLTDAAMLVRQARGVYLACVNLDDSGSAAGYAENGRPALPERERRFVLEG